MSNGNQPRNHEHLGKLDLAYRLSTLAIESQNRSMTAHDDMQVEISMKEHPMMMTMTQKSVR